MLSGSGTSAAPRLVGSKAARVLEIGRDPNSGRTGAANSRASLRFDCCKAASEKDRGFCTVKLKLAFDAVAGESLRVELRSTNGGREEGFVKEAHRDRTFILSAPSCRDNELSFSVPGGSPIESSIRIEALVGTCTAKHLTNDAQAEKSVGEFVDADGFPMAPIDEISAGGVSVAFDHGLPKGAAACGWNRLL